MLLFARFAIAQRIRYCKIVADAPVVVELRHKSASSSAIKHGALSTVSIEHTNEKKKGTDSSLLS